MEQQVKWKERLVDLFYEPEDEVERDPNLFVLELSGWKLFFVIIGLSCIMSMTIFSYVYIFNMYRTVQTLCSVPLQQMSGSVAKGGIFEVNTSKGPMLVELEPIPTDSTTHRHLKCTIPNF